MAGRGRSPGAGRKVAGRVSAPLPVAASAAGGAATAVGALPADHVAAAQPVQPLQMADIARLAGVAVSTVSRALNGSALIPEATRDRIIAIARSANYQINAGAANLRRRDVRTVGVVVLGDSQQALSDPFVLSLFGAVADALVEQGQNVLLTRHGDARESLMEAMVRSRQVSGLIVMGQYTLHEHLNALVDSGLHLAVWGADLPDARYPVVGSDNEQGGYLATRHLLRQGCQRIAFLGDIDHPETGHRHAGYCRALAEAGLAPDDRLRQPVLFGEPRLRKVVNDWIDAGVGFDGVFASGDVAAMLVVNALLTRGIAVPGQVRVAGYDDIEMSAYVHPSLTTVRQPVRQAGRALVELLQEAQQGLPRRSVVLPTELVTRDSTA